MFPNQQSRNWLSIFDEMINFIFIESPFVVSFTVNRWGVMIFKKKVYFLKLLLNDSWMTWTILFLCALLTDINSLKSNNSRIEWDLFRRFHDFADFLWCVKLWDEVRDCGHMILIQYLIFFKYLQCWYLSSMLISIKVTIELSICAKFHIIFTDLFYDK